MITVFGVVFGVIITGKDWLGGKGLTACLGEAEEEGTTEVGAEVVLPEAGRAEAVTAVAGALLAVAALTMNQAPQILTGEGPLAGTPQSPLVNQMQY